MSNHAFGYLLLFLLSGSFVYPVKWIQWLLTPKRQPVGAATTAGVPAPVRADARLTPEQQRLVSEWIERWDRLHVDDGIEDHARIEAAILRRYAIQDRPHVLFQWVASPGAAWEVALFLGLRPELGWKEPRRRLPSYALRPAGELPAVAREQIGGELARAVSAWQDMPVILGAMPGPSSLAGLQTQSATSDHVPRFLTCCRDVLGVRYVDGVDEDLDAFMQTARCFAWWWPNESTCVVSMRPTVVHRDQQGRLHHPHEAAVEFRDGFSAFAWHGTCVPESWIRTPEILSVDQALNWPDFTQRRAAQQIVGWKRIVDALDVRTIDADADPSIGELVETVLPNGMRALFLKVRCGTGRDFILSVPRWTRTAREANAWTYGLSSDQYQPEVRT